MSLTVREQNRFIAALDNLRTSERVHKSDLKTVNKTLDKMGGVANSKELLASLSDRMRNNFDIKDSKNVDSFIENVKVKLERQESKIHDKKLNQLNNIGNRIFQASQNIEVDHLSNTLELKTQEAYDLVENAKYDKDVVHKMIDKRNEAKDLEASVIQQSELLTPDKINADKLKRVNNLEQETDRRINKLNEKINDVSRKKGKLVDFINHHGKTGVLEDLNQTKNNKYLLPTMATSDYAKKMFGTKTILVEGRRSYSAKTKTEVLSDSGANFLTLIKSYRHARLEVPAIRKEISQLKSTKDAQIASIMAEKRSPQQVKYDAIIAEYQEDYKYFGEIESLKLNTLAKTIEDINSTIEDTTALNKVIEQKAERMADPKVKNLAARHDKSIGELAVEKQKLENSYQRLVEASNTGKNYVSDVESHSDTDTDNDYVSHV